MMKRFVTICSLFVCTALYAGPTTIESITVHNRPASELVHIIKPLLSPDGSVQSYNHELIIKDTPDQIKAILGLVEKLDVKATRLMVSISQGADKPSQAFQVDEDGQVHFENKPSTTKTRTRHYQTTREAKRSIHHLSMNAGETAFIQSGVSIPIVIYEDGFAHQRTDQYAANETRVRQQSGLEATVPAVAGTQIQAPTNLNALNTTNLILAVPPVTNALIKVPATPGANINVGLSREEETRNANAAFAGNAQSRGYGQSTYQKELQSGVYVQPTLIKDEVKLYVQSIEQRPHKAHRHNTARNKPSYSTHRMETTLMVPLGQWVYIGGNQKETDMQNWQYGTRDRTLEKSHIWVRVDKVD